MAPWKPKERMSKAPKAKDRTPKPVARHNGRTRALAPITFRVSKVERAKLEALARARKLTLSDLIRERVLGDPEPIPQKRERERLEAVACVADALGGK